MATKYYVAFCCIVCHRLKTIQYSLGDNKNYHLTFDFLNNGNKRHRSQIKEPSLQDCLFGMIMKRFL